MQPKGEREGVSRVCRALELAKEELVKEGRTGFELAHVERAMEILGCPSAERSGEKEVKLLKRGVLPE